MFTFHTKKQVNMNNSIFSKTKRFNWNLIDYVKIGLMRRVSFFGIFDCSPICDITYYFFSILVLN